MPEAVSAIGILFLAEASEGWVDFDELAEGLEVTRAQLRNPARRYPWETFAELCRRFERVAGAAAAEELGRRATRSDLLIPYRKLLGLAVDLRTGYKFGLGWLIPALYGVPFIRVETEGQDHLSIVITIPDEHGEALAWFRILKGGMEEFSVTFAGVRAHVDAQLSPREGRFQLRLPAMRVTRLAQVLRLFGADEAITRITEHTEGLERRRAKWELDAQRSKRRLTRILEATSDLVALINAGGKVVYAGASVERVLGYPPEAVVGRGFLDFVVPAEHAAAASWMSRVLAQSGERHEFEVVVVAADGSGRRLHCAGQNFVSDPDLLGVLVTARDITESHAAAARLERQEASFERLVANLKGMAYRCRNDDAWTMELVSEGALEITGYPAHALRDNRLVAFGDLVHPEDRDPLHAKRQTNLAAHKACSNEYRIKVANGQYRWVLDVASGVYDEQGHLVAIEGFLADVTDRIRLEEQLSHAQRLESVGRLAGGIAHDFNNLLAVILSYSELIQRDLSDNDPVGADLRQVMEAARKGGELTRQLLAFARKQPIEPRILDLGPRLTELRPLLTRATGDDIQVLIDDPTDLPPVLFDPGQFEQIVVNLVVNARDAMPQGGSLHLSLSAVRVDRRKAESEGAQSGAFVRLRVKDSGIGMSPDVLERIFEPFFTTKEAGRGSGLGLATTYGLVRQAGGFLEVTSRPGEGARFDIYLPGAERRGVLPTPSEEPTGPTFGTETILLVEDHPEVRQATARILSTYGYQVLVAEDGPQALALEIGCMVPIHLLVTDFLLPHMSGEQVAERVRRRRPDMRVLYMSGSPVANLELHSGDAFLCKPWEPQRLARLVRRVLDRRGLEAGLDDSRTTVAPERVDE